MAYHVWIEEMDGFLRENYPSLGPTKTLKIMKEKFSPNLTLNGLKHRARKLNLKKNSIWTKEIDNFLRENYTKFGYKRCQQLIEEKFGQSIDINYVREHAAYSLQIQSPRNYEAPQYRNYYSNKLWTEEMDTFMIEHYPDLGPKAILPLMKGRFGKDFTRNAIAKRASALKLKFNGRIGVFEEGYKPPTTHKIGDEVTYKGKIFIKVDDKKFFCGGKTDNFKLKHLVVWEDHFGPIPEDCLIIFADRDFSNCSIDNLRCVPKKYMPLLATRNKWLFGGSEVLDAAIAWCDLYFTLKELQKKKGEIT